MGGGVQRCWGAFVGDIGAGGLGWTGPCGAPAGCSKGLARRVPAMCPVPGPSQPPQPLRNQCRAQVLIFVPSRHQTRATALDLINLAAADERQPRYVHMPPAELEAVMASIKVGGGGACRLPRQHVGEGAEDWWGLPSGTCTMPPSSFPPPGRRTPASPKPGGGLRTCLETPTLPLNTPGAFAGALRPVWHRPAAL